MSNDWTRVDEVFASALDLEGTERDEFIGRECAGDTDLEQRVRRLLDAASRAEGFLEQDPSLVREAFEDQHPELLKTGRPPGLTAGERVGPYEVLECVGSGGMGSVYLAERADGQFSQRVAIKVVHESAVQGQPAQRFLRERQILADLQHPNIARLFDGGYADDGRPYVIMEFVDGVPLTDYCREKQLDLAARLDLFETVCAAVHYAHGKGVIHRDLKPSNILVTDEGRVMLLDFGIAKLTAEGEDTLTRTGVRVLTPAYASPEQTFGIGITPASDVFQLGLLLYELIAGRLPAGEHGEAPTVVAGRTRAGDLDAVCAKARDPEPERRYETASHLAADVRRYAEGRPVRARQRTPVYLGLRWLARHRVVASVVAGLAVVSLVGGYIAGGGGTGPAARGQSMLLLAGAVVVVALLGAVAWTRGSRTDQRSVAEGADAPGGDSARTTDSAPLDPRTVAILPFETTGEHAEDDPFVIGLHDDLLTELSRVDTLTVISRSSVSRYETREGSIADIGRDLGAGTIVEGTARRAGERIRLNIKVIDVPTDVHRWAESYDCELTAVDIFDLQSDLARQIARTLRGELTTTQHDVVRASPTENREAYRLYVQGSQCMLHRSKTKLERAAEFFQGAVEHDPEYALAWAGLGNALILLGDYQHGDRDDVLPRGEAAARRALEIDPNLAEANTALGNLYSASHDLDRATHHHGLAVDARPGHAPYYHWFGWCQLLAGDARAALEAGRQAVRLDPLDAEGRTNYSFAHLASGDFEGAFREATRAAEGGWESDYIPWAQALSLLAAGRDEEALELLKDMDESWSRPWIVGPRAHLLSESGDRAGADLVLSDIDPEYRDFHVAVVQLFSGEDDAALETITAAERFDWPETLYFRYVMPLRFGPMQGAESRARWTAHIDTRWGLRQNAT